MYSARILNLNKLNITLHCVSLKFQDVARLSFHTCMPYVGRAPGSAAPQLFDVIGRNYICAANCLHTKHHGEIYRGYKKRRCIREDFRKNRMGKIPKLGGGSKIPVKGNLGQKNIDSKFY